jgi:HAMP domain-containing protein
MSLFVKFNVMLLLVFGLALAPAAYLANEVLQDNAREQVVQNARIMMQSALATRSYTSQQILPLLSAQQGDAFLPQTVPSYSATEIFNTLRKSNPDYTYKEATLNPTNLRDRTSDWEADVVSAFRNDPSLTELIGERTDARGRSLHLARPIQINDAACLKCHSTADAAPASMLKAYGASNGFGWKLQEVIGAQIVSVPMTVPVAMAAKTFKALLVALLGVLLAMALVLNLLLWFVVIRPIKRLSGVADQISGGKMDAPEFEVRGTDEVAVLAGSFNRMRISLAKALVLLEEP